MGAIFKNDFHDDIGTFGLGYIPYGGADYGEIVAVARAVGDGDDDAFFEGWMAAGDRIAAEARAALAKGRRAGASALFLRASAFYGCAYRPLYGAPVDPRLSAAFGAQIAAFDQGLALREPAVTPARIPFGEAFMPAYLIPALGRERERRPLIILNNGYDATVTDMFFASAVAATRRGYHCLLFDGPGQGSMLIEQGVRLRADWEVVIRAVTDFAVAQDIVDPARIALSGWSLGGYLAPRGASGEPRIAALIADPGLWSMAEGFKTFAKNLGAPAGAAARLGDLEQSVLDALSQAIARDRKLRWSFVQRGYWVHGVDTLRDYLASAEEFTLEGRAELIACPTLITQAEDDPLSSTARMLFDALRCRKDFLAFSAAEGADGHCEMRNRSLLNRRVFDWLDDLFGLEG